MPTLGIGESFTAAEMRSLPEFNPGGRHPIFGSSLWDGSWWRNEHWGLGIGHLPIGPVVFIALTGVAAYLLLRARRKSPTPELKDWLSSAPLVLFCSSAALYFVARISFPVLYMPSRYTAVPLLLLTITRKKHPKAGLFFIRKYE